MDKRISAATIREVWLDDGLTVAKAAAKVGLAPVNLWIRAKKLGLPPRKEGRRRVIPAAELEVLWMADVRVADIATLYASPYKSVSQAARGLGLPRRSSAVHHIIRLEDFRVAVLRKSQTPGCKLSDAERSILARMRQQ